ncbi:MAG: cytochrome c oxidase subunit II [Anaerolineales bacterium]|nr:cytochrome c oxidase subunit II [Anaerolineales bacterium]
MKKAFQPCTVRKLTLPGHSGICLLLLLFLPLLSACASVSGGVLDPQGPEAQRVAYLSWLMFGVAAVVFTVVTVLLLLTAVRTRRQSSVEYSPESDHRALNGVIVGGVVIPAVVLLIIMGLSIAVQQISAAPASGDLTVEIVGHQWWWEVHYPDYGVTTANEIHIPAGRPVLIKLTSADVIHSFWAPQLHSKLDLIPGQTNSFVLQADNAGVYRGQCAEFCGLQHAHMVFLVVADKTDDFNTWLDQQRQSAPEPDEGSFEQEGQQAFLGSACVYCHTIKGTNASGTLGPDLTHVASRQTIGAGILPNGHGYLAGWIMNSQTVKPGNEMPPMDLDAEQLQAILAYLDTLK